MVAHAQSSFSTFPLSDDERECFGWADVPIVMSTKTPEGRRSIPTREITSRGQVVYGSIETFEPPPGFDPDLWAASFGDVDEPSPGLRN